MIVSGPQTDSYERVFANFYLSFNGWWTTDWGVSKTVRQMRGFGVFLYIDQAYLTGHTTGTVYAGNANGGFVNWKVFHDPNGFVIGKAVGVAGSAGGVAELPFPYVGPIESSFLSGSSDPAMARWVLVQLYGFHDSIYSSGATATDEGLYIQNETGVHGTFSKEKAGGGLQLAGVVTINTSLASALLSLDGTDSTGTTWSEGPRTGTVRRDPGTGNVIATGGNTPRGDRAIVGYNIRNSLVTDAYGSQRTRGFVMCLGTNLGRVS